MGTLSAIKHPEPQSGFMPCAAQRNALHFSACCPPLRSAPAPTASRPPRVVPKRSVEITAIVPSYHGDYLDTPLVLCSRRRQSGETPERSAPEARRVWHAAVARTEQGAPRCNPVRLAHPAIYPAASPSPAPSALPSASAFSPRTPLASPRRAPAAAPAPCSCRIAPARAT